MFNDNPNGFKSTNLYLGEKPSGRLAEFFGITPAREVPDPSAVAPTDDVEPILAELEKTLGADALEKIVSVEDRERLKADPVARARFKKQLDVWTADHHRRAAKASAESAAAETAQLEQERHTVALKGKALADAVAKAASSK